MSQQIQDYALIGDLRTAALVGSDGAIDWLSVPRFDSPAVYAALLGDSRHGQWTLAPAASHRSSQRRYRTDTLILETDWTTAEGLVKVTDLMVPGAATPTVVRVVEGISGTVAMRTRIAPRMGYGRRPPTFRRSKKQLIAVSGVHALSLSTDVDLCLVDASWMGHFVVSPGQRICFTFSYMPASDVQQPIQSADTAVAATAAFWTEWVNQSTYSGPWTSEVKQSLMVLKALTFAPTGSILAAATTSLPETIGGSRNWDYRYSWLRDATFTLRAFLATGHVDEVVAWRDWLVRTVLDNPSEPRIMYAVDGASHLPEEILGWLPGHAGSAPVRIGNEAAKQQQNDVWGEVLDILAEVRDAGVPNHPDQATLEQALLVQIQAHWREPDHGLWEVRGPRRHFLHSKLLTWVGIDRAIRGHEHLGIEEPHQLARLSRLRHTVAREIVDRGYHVGLKAFTQSYGSARLDASILLMPRYGFLPWHDDRVIATVDAIERDLTCHGLVRRYLVDDGVDNVDGVPGGEGTFLATSFWLADALHGMGRTDDAAALFERLLGLRNDVGLLSEEYDPVTGNHLGNTPQAFSHAALVTTAVTLSASSASTSGRDVQPDLPLATRTKVA